MTKRYNHHRTTSYNSELEEARTRIRELMDINEDLRRHDRLKDEFINNVSHELRTSLTSVKNVISNALDGVSGNLSEELRRSLLIADDNIRRFTHIINDLLDVAKLESGKIALYRSLIDPKQIVTSIVASFEGEASKNGIGLHIDWKIPQALVFMDGNRIAQVLGNLIGNALKFTPWGGVVYVRGLAVDSRGNEISGQVPQESSNNFKVAVAVEDTGPGIDPKRLRKIFNRYEQADGIARHPNEEGLGLGLTISRQLITLHGGKIWAENVQPNGARFTFTLPFLKKEEVFREALADRIHIARIHCYTLALIIIDFDFEKSLLQKPSFPEKFSIEIESMIQQALRRKTDTLIWRGEGRFAIILPQASIADANVVLGRLLDTVDVTKLSPGDPTNKVSTITAIAEFPTDGETVNDIISTAEKRLDQN